MFMCNYIMLSKYFHPQIVHRTRSSTCILCALKSLLTRCLHRPGKVAVPTTLYRLLPGKVHCVHT